AGFDRHDFTTQDVPAMDYLSALHESPKVLRVGVPRTHFYEDLDPEVAAAVEKAVDQLKTSVAEVRDIELAVPTARTLQAAEAYAFHARSAAETQELYFPETLRRIRAGAEVTASEYIQKRHEMEEARRSIKEIFKDVDLLVTPTMPMPAPSIEELKKN